MDSELLYIHLFALEGSDDGDSYENSAILIHFLFYLLRMNKNLKRLRMRPYQECEYEGWSLYLEQNELKELVASTRNLEELWIHELRVMNGGLRPVDFGAHSFQLKKIAACCAVILELSLIHI